MVYLYIFIYMIVLSTTFDLLMDSNEVKASSGLRKSIIYIIFIPAFLLAALRKNVGTDYMVYSLQKIPGVINGWNVGIEPLYRGIIKLGVFLGNIQYIFVITHLIILFFVCKSVFSSNQKLTMAIVAFWGSGFFNYSLNIMRQAIAMSIFLYALQFIDKNKKKYFLLILIACLFHESAVIYFLFFFIKDLKLKSGSSILILVFVWLFRNFIRSIIEFITSHTGLYNQYFGSILDTNKTGWAFLIINLSIYLLYLLVVCLTKADWLSDRYLLIQYIATFATILSSTIPNYERFMYLFMVIQIISVPYFIKKIHVAVYRWLFVFLICILYFILFDRLFIVGNIGETFPYTSIFG